VACILVIDDSDGVRSVLRAALEAAGHQVVEARDGAEGLKAFRQQLTDLVFCDIFMPGKEGLATIRELRREFPDVKIIAMSGGGFNGTMNMLPLAARLGAAQLLDKPFGSAAALAALERALAGERCPLLCKLGAERS
jgi:CheY-like chemotaxis protein